MDEFLTSRRHFMGGMAAGSIAGGVGGFPLGAHNRDSVATGALQSGTPPSGLYLKIPDIQGESQTAGHENEIEVLSFSWGVSRASSRGTGRATGAAQFDSLVLTKGIDRATPQLLELAVTGAHRPEAVLSLTRATDGPEADVYTVTLEDVEVLTFDNNGMVDAGPIESYSLSFGKVRVEYRMLNGDGNVQEYTFGWDVRANRPT
ncbi:type VI secretion system tube protein Hcp [Halogeometricum sp. S1BR25-6]|uniref:Type VI secretion system tube protein Hcp n=1 Tax=Halogeometricum salsisoli TaxID=2950536 RepID=A0ABU2G9C6_9EURY|nr:type VI secretion system tube protein Hcp [Halogeometricum sp. S1BR25-6]MDS0297374.1 type VI secretion system tube protein Hcp [Halogeometricum sp. S1BR25-6]